MRTLAIGDTVNCKGRCYKVARLENGRAHLIAYDPLGLGPVIEVSAFLSTIRHSPSRGWVAWTVN